MSPLHANVRATFPYSPQEQDDFDEIEEAGPSAISLIRESLQRAFKDAIAGRRATLPTAVCYNAAAWDEADRFVYSVVERPTREVLAKLMDCDQGRERQIAALLLGAPVIFTGWLSGAYVAGEDAGLLSAGWKS